MAAALAAEEGLEILTTEDGSATLVEWIGEPPVGRDSS